MKFSTILGAGLVANGVMAAPASDSATTKVQKRQSNSTKMTATNKLMWNTSIMGFQTARNNRNPSYLNWSSDGCSFSRDRPNGWPFIYGCYRHDFGYRNYKAQGRFTTPGKASIDSKFYNEYVTLSFYPSS